MPGEGASFGDSDSLADAMAYYGQTILLAYDLTKVSLYTSGWGDFNGTFLPVGANRMRFEGAARSCFFNTSQGMKIWDGTGDDGEPVNAGAPAGLDMDAQPTSESGWMTSDSAVAYRYTVCAKDAFGRIIEGAPSGRTTMRNILQSTVGSTSRSGTTVTVAYNVDESNPFTLAVSDSVVLTSDPADEARFPSGAKTILTVNSTFSTFTYTESATTDGSNTATLDFAIAASGQLVVWLPPDASLLNFIRVYRSDQTLGGASDEPSDEMDQCYESGYLTAADLAGGFVAFIDTAPQSQLNVPLYTNNNTGDAALAAFYQPPKALDITYWTDRMWSANTENKHSLQFSILGTGTPDGLVNGSDLQIYHSDAVQVLFQGVTSYDPFLSTPVALPFSTAGGGGTLTPGTYYYRIVATAASGVVYSLPSIEASQVVSGGTDNTITINWEAVTGATHYKIYGRTTGAELLIATVASAGPFGNDYVDDGTITPSGALPVKPSMGDYFYIRTDGDPGANVETTAKSLVRSINLSLNNTASVALNAYYVASEGGIPGAMQLVARSFGDAYSFELHSTYTHQAWVPQLPSPSPDAQFPPPTSNDNAHPARLWYSPLGIPDAAPLLYFVPVNSDNDAILRIFPLNYRLLVFKTDGIYTCTNLEPFTVAKLSAYRLLAPDSVCVLEDRVYALTDQGVITISDAGLIEISTPIDDLLNGLMSPDDIATTAARAFAVAYRSERQVILWVPQEGDDDVASSDNAQAFVFSTLSKGFTRYDFGARTAAIDPDANTLVFAPTDDNTLYVENKTLGVADYFDLADSIGTPSGLVSGFTGSLLTFSADVVATMGVGDVLSSSADDYFPIISISGNDVELSGYPSWTTSTSLTIFHAIETDVEFNKLTAGTPAELKMIGQVSLLFRENGIHDTVVSFASEIAPLATEVTKEGVGWGEFAWGRVPYGSVTQQILRIEPIPTSAAQCAQLSVGFSTRQALAKYGFLGIDVVEAEDTKVNRGG